MRPPSPAANWPPPTPSARDGSGCEETCPCSSSASGSWPMYAPTWRTCRRPPPTEACMTGHDTPAFDTPAGPWVWVIGMHRSGTSVATGILHELGLGVPEGDDLMVGRDDNPNHFESWALMTV